MSRVDRRCVLTCCDNVLPLYDMKPVIRAAALRGFVPLAAELGGDGASILRRFGIVAADLDDDDAVIVAGSKSQALEAAAVELDCPDFGLRLAARQDASVLGPLAVAIENSATVKDAIDCASRFMFVHSPALSVTLEPTSVHPSKTVDVIYRSTQWAVSNSPQAMDLGLGLVHRTLMLLLGQEYSLQSAHLPHRPLVAVSLYEDFFAAPVQFDNSEAALRFDANLARTPIAGSNDVVRSMALDYLDRHYAERQPTASERVDAVIAKSMGSAPVRIETVANLLLVHPRTLQRQLASEGTTFEGVLDDVRKRTAHRLITETDLPLSQVTSMVGLAEQSALTRASRRWFGDPPRSLRHKVVAQR